MWRTACCTPSSRSDSADGPRLRHLQVHGLVLEVQQAVLQGDELLVHLLELLADPRVHPALEPVLQLLAALLLLLVAAQIEPDSLPLQHRFLAALLRLRGRFRLAGHVHRFVRRQPGERHCWRAPVVELLVVVPVVKWGYLLQGLL